MKKLISFSLALMLLLGVLAVPAMAEEAELVGTLSYLSITEEEDEMLRSSVRQPMIRILYLHGVLTNEGNENTGVAPTLKHYDSLNALQMALQSGEVNEIKLPYYTARYLCSTSDGLKIMEEYHPEKATTASADWALARLSDGYSFMMKEDNTELRDEFDEQIKAMKEDGTLQKLVEEHIIKVAEGGEPVAVDFEQFEGDPIRVGVTGDLPPMDYKSADNSFAGFNTAVLAEIGRRLKRNIELVQVESVGRALALSQGLVDVVFWTRALSEKTVDDIVADRGLSDEEQKAKRDERFASWTDEEKAILSEIKETTKEEKLKMKGRDMPSGTIITRPYFSDFPVLVTLKETK